MRFKWKNYQNVLIPDLPPHYEIKISEKEIYKLIKEYDVYFARWVSDWDNDKGCFWYVIKDKKEDISKYSRNTRSKIKRGLKKLTVEKIDKEVVAKYGYEVYINAFKRYKTFLRPQQKEEFIKNVLKKGKNIEYWGVFLGEKLVAYSENLIEDNVCNYSTIKFHPDYLKFYSSYALFYEMNRYYLNEKNFLYVNDGARSLSHQTNIQEYLIKKFHFRKAYCRLNVVYRKDIEILVNILFPFRKLFYKIEGSFFKKLSVLLRHEEIRKCYGQ